jgi:MFS family permease
MYPLEWIEKLKVGRATASPAAPIAISPVVLSLGLTSLLTDISSEMVNSLLPAYVVLHLHLSPMQFGFIDGLYNGFAIALLSLAAGFMADRVSRQKEVALVGYSISGLCKLLLLAVGTTYGGLLTVIGLDRLGKGIRAAPRDALISLNTPSSSFASAFSVHRAMDACGSLLGPVVAFALLTLLPGAFDAVWITSFAFAGLGVAALWLFVPKSQPVARAAARVATPFWQGLRSRRFLVLAGCGALLALTTISDGFVYLMLQQKSATAAGYFPLFYVMTAAGYMVFAIPAGRIADRVSRRTVFMSGYGVLIALYALLTFQDHVGTGLLVGCLALLGLYYAATEGILMALTSAVVPAERRTAGIAIVATGIGLGKLGSSIAFGALWQAYGMQRSVLVFAGAMGVALAVTWTLLRQHERGTT